MILLRVFFDFEVEVLEGFEAWFLILAELFYFWILVSFQPFSGSLQDLLRISSSPFSSPASTFLKCFGKLLFIGVWGWVSDTWRSLIGDTCHTIIGLLVSSLTCVRLLVSSLTRARLLVSSLTCTLMCDLVFAWHLANFCWFLNSDSKT